MKSIISILLMSNVHAAFNTLSVHSRANCLNNESITWDWTKEWNLNTQTSHYRNGHLKHVFSTGWQVTWRSAAVHWTEGIKKGKWKVLGDHYFLKKRGDIINIAHTEAVDCAVMAGWWEVENKKSTK